MKLSTQDKATLLTLEESLWRAETRFDPELMDRTFAADFVEFGRSGRRYDRAEMLFAPDAAAEIDATLPLPDYDIAPVGPGVALATYTSQVRYAGTVEVGRRASLWVKRAGRWRLRFHQGTAC